MTNVVDTSKETIDMEFDAAEREIGTVEDVAAAESVEQEKMEEAANAAQEAQRQAEVEMATGMISASLQFCIGGFTGVSVDEEHYKKAGEAYAVLIIKYYPGGIFAFLDRFKEEITAASMTFVLVREVSKARKLAAEEAAKKAAEEKARAQAQRQQQPPVFNNTNFQAGGAASGNA